MKKLHKEKVVESSGPSGPCVFSSNIFSKIRSRHNHLGRAMGNITQSSPGKMSMNLMFILPLFGI